MSSTPVSLREGPLATNALVLKRYVVVYVLVVWASTVPPAALAVWLATGSLRWAALPTWMFVLLLPAVVLLLWFTWVLSSIAVSWVVLRVVILLHRPREGVFRRDRGDRDYRHWSLRATVRKFAFWTARTFYPLPLVLVLAFKVLGYKRRGVGTVLFDCWVDPEFTEIGRGVKLGLGCNVLGSMVVADKLVVKKTVVGAGTVVGVGAVITPGTVVGENCAIGALSTTELGQVLEAGWIYTGVPVRKVGLNQLDLDGADGAGASRGGFGPDGGEADPAGGVADPSGGGTRSKEGAGGGGAGTGGRA
ncbi:MAG: hypothetical protein ACTSU5_12640 [Promethearchaeota archaeon]